MKTTGIYTHTKYEIKFKNYGDRITLIPFGDVHRSSQLCHVEKWHEFLKWAKEQKNAYFLGMGDYNDLASTSERSILSNEHLHESTKYDLESLYRKQTLLFANEIDFMKGRLIGLVEGNHFAYLSSGITTTQLMAESLGCKYLGVSSFIRLILKKDTHDTHQIDIWAHHGLGGGRTQGSDINKIEQMIRCADAQIYLMGHSHKKHVAMQSRLRLRAVKDGVDLDNQKIILARTGAFLKGYENEKASYIADGAYSPTDIGTVSITITPKRNKERRWLELNASL